MSQSQPKGQDGVYSSEMTGAVRAYLGLAYDLYLCAHNAELPEPLLKRRRNAQTFEGAVYEARVIGSLARAGFHIELEDKTDSDRSHCELTVGEIIPEGWAVSSGISILAAHLSRACRQDAR